MLLTVTDFLDTDYVAMLDAVGRPPGFEEVVVLRGPAGADLAWSDFLARAEDVPAEASAARAVEVEPGDMSDIVFTSGTTGGTEGGDAAPTRRASGPTPRGPTWSACGRATATSSSTRSSTPSG